MIDEHKLSPEMKVALESFLQKKEERDKKRKVLKETIRSYILEKVNNKNFHSVSKSKFMKIEEKIQRMVDKLIEENLDEMSGEEIIRRSVSHRTNNDYELENDEDIIEIMDNIPQSSLDSDTLFDYKTDMRRNWDFN